MDNNNSETPEGIMICEQKLRFFSIFSNLLVVVMSLALLPLHVYAQTPSSAPRIQSNNLSLLGTFKLPSGTLGSTYGFSYAGTGGLGTYGITYNPANTFSFYWRASV